MNRKDVVPSATLSDAGVPSATRLCAGGGHADGVTRRCQRDFHRQGRRSPIRLIG
jgi:hypothetical protein